MELLSSDISEVGVLKQTGLPRLPSCIKKYFFCTTGLDKPFRCLPTEGGFYNQRYIDYIEFGIIEQRLREKRDRYKDKTK